MLTDDERNALLRRVSRQSATVGARVPDTITVHGETIPLQEFIIETRKIGTIPPETGEVLSSAKQALYTERAERYDRLKTASLTAEQAEQLADEIVGIDRARNALDRIRHPDFGDEVSAATIDDHKRWLGFLRQIR